LKEKPFHFSDLKLESPFYINTLDFNNREGLKIVIKPKQANLIQILTEEATPILLILLFVALLSIPLAYLFSKYPSKLEKEIEEQNKYLERRVEKAVKSYQENEKMLLHQNQLAQMGEMISMIAHQWRQPLTAISIAVSGLIMRLNRDDSYNKELIEKKLLSVEEQAQGLSNVINDFRDFYSPKEFEKETSIDILIESCLQVISPQLTASNIDVTTDLKSKETFKLFENHLKQAIIAILQNAQDAYKMRTSDNKLIEIDTYTKDNSHIIEISDHAGGISEEIIEDIFTPYFSTKESKNGTGLGLYMTKLIIEKHCKGTISVRNSTDGAVFTIMV
jgi:signal transduction histidine kinase